MKKVLIDNAYPKIEGNIEVKGFFNITPSNTCIVNFPLEDIDNSTVNILEASYDFNKRSNLSEQVVQIKVNKKIDDFTDIMKQQILDIKKMQGGDISDSDILTRFQSTPGSLSIRTSGLLVYTRTGLGSSFVLSLGGAQTNPQAGGRLGSIIGSGINFLGDSRNGLVLIYSGGYF